MPFLNPPVMQLARASRNAAMRAGLPSKWSTPAGRTASSCMRRPHPVNMITGVLVDMSFTPVATAFPSTRGMPRSVMTAS